MNSESAAPSYETATQEPRPVVSRPADIIFSIELSKYGVENGKTTKEEELKIERSVKSMIEAELRGCGNVQIAYINFHRQFTSRGQMIHVEMLDENAQYVPNRLHQWVWSEVSTKYTRLINEVKEFEIPDFLSRQMIPVSSMAPSWKFIVQKSPGARLTLEVGCHVNGPIRKVLSPSF